MRIVSLVAFWCVVACGKVSDESGTHPNGTGSAPGSDAGAVPGETSEGGPTRGVGGRGGAGAADAGTGGSGGAGPTSGTGGFGNFGGDQSTVPDIHADERNQVATKFCSLLEKYPCLTYSGNSLAPVPPADAPLAQRLAACRSEVEINAFALVGEACWDLWVAATTCEATMESHECPCSGQNCTLSAFAGANGGPCASALEAMNECVGKQSESGVAIGPDGRQCGYGRYAAQECDVECSSPAFSFVESRCDGPPGGPLRCPCLINGRLLLDDATEAERWFLATDCKDVAQQLANGTCYDGLNCCFEWHETVDGGTVDHCSCTADPTQPQSDGTPGFASCEAAAAAGHGKVVPLCPKYEPNESAYPKP